MVKYPGFHTMPNDTKPCWDNVDQQQIQIGAYYMFQLIVT